MSMVFGTAVRYELRSGPVMVSVSPVTEVVMPVAPANRMVSPEFSVVPVESSPTIVVVELVRYEERLGPVIVTTSSTTEVVMPVAPVNFRVSAVLIVEPDESSPTNVMPAKEFKLVKLNVPEPFVTRT